MAKQKSAKIDPDKAVMADTMDDLLKETKYSFSSVKRGDQVTGKIISLSPNELLVDVGSKSFAQVLSKELVGIRDLIASLSIGDTITGTVIYPENELGYIVISLRNLGYEKRWDTLSERFENDQEIEVKGLDIAKGGLLVEYAGIRGFIPASQLDPTSSADPQKLKSKKIRVKILELNKKNTRFVLSQKAVTQKDVIQKQREALDKFEVGKKYQALVTGTASFGIFVVVPFKEEGVEIEGLIHISEIAWEKVEDPQKYVKMGSTIDVMIIGIDKTSGRLNLSIKQLTPDPWKHIEEKYKKEQHISGRVSRVSSFGVFVTLESGIEGLVHISKIPPGEEPKEGDTLDCLIENVDAAKRKISLSMIPKAKPVGYR